MKAQDDAPLFVDMPRLATRISDVAYAPTIMHVGPTYQATAMVNVVNVVDVVEAVDDEPIFDEPTRPLRDLSTACVVPPMPPLAIRMSDLRGRHPPIRLADLRGDDLRDETSHARAA